MYNALFSEKEARVFRILGSEDFPSGPVAKTTCSQRRGPRFNPWSGNLIPHAATKCSHAKTKDPACCN